MGGVTIDGYGDSVQCVGDIDGNDTGAQSTFLSDLNGGSIFAGFDSVSLGDMWTLFGKSDEVSSVSADEGSVSGNWGANGVDDTVVVTLKAGNFFSAFLFTGVLPGDVTGTFDTALSGITVGQGNSPALSHLSVWTVGSDDGPAPIPVPAAGLLLLTALGAGAALRKRKV